MPDQPYDLLVIGGGPGGYVAAIRASQLGMKAACIDEREGLGGTCLNIGCIPSKALLNSSEKFWEAQTDLKRFGVVVESVRLDLGAMMNQKAQAVRTLTKGVGHLFKKHKIDHIRGRGSFTGHAHGDTHRVEVRGQNGQEHTVEARRVILATGSVPVHLPGIDVDETRILTSTGALALAEVPRHLVVIGGGYIGLEMGSVWRRLGAQVTCIEYMERIIPGMDGDLARELKKVLEEQGFSFRLRTKVVAAHVKDDAVTVTLEPAEGGSREEVSCSHVLVAVGRRPYTDGLGLEEAGVDVDDHGFIRIDHTFRTSVDGIFAIGDLARQPMLAHKAMDEAVACVDNIAGRSGHVNYDTIPAIVYTWPEVASVGRTEEELQKQNVKYRVGRFPYRANSRARCTEELSGFVKILADAETDLILGAHILGPDAGTTIHEVVTTMEFGASAEELARTSHGHPTVNEAVREAALAVHQRQIHI